MTGKEAEAENYSLRLCLGALSFLVYNAINPGGLGADPQI